MPQLAKYPSDYIYEPWKAPLPLQKGCGCLIGTDYPAPIIDHKEASQRNIARMKTMFAGGTIDLEETKGEETAIAAPSKEVTEKGIELSVADEEVKSKDKRRANAKSTEPKGRG